MSPLLSTIPACALPPANPKSDGSGFGHCLAPPPLFSSGADPLISAGMAGVLTAVACDQHREAAAGSASGTSGSGSSR
jgi:hypothetical protein